MNDSASRHADRQKPAKLTAQPRENDSARPPAKLTAQPANLDGARPPAKLTAQPANLAAHARRQS
ncbi:hypothetical protein J5X84_16790 [Streptosporangiaceae bacterium NEAU-GS5]|nr:hypothetical protein [Streptosporangiaceae bacterium NEAU-GS5]